MTYIHFYSIKEGIVNIRGNIEFLYTKKNHNTCYKSVAYCIMLPYLVLRFLPSNEDLIPENLIILEAWISPGLSPKFLV